MMRSFWLFVLAEFCRRCETKGTWRGVCSGVPSGVQGQSSWGEGQGEPHEVVGFLALGWPKEKANALSGCYFINCSRAVRLRKVVRVLFCCLRTGHEWINGHGHNLDVERCIAWCANATDLTWKFHFDLLLTLMNCSCNCIHVFVIVKSVRSSGDQNDFPCEAVWCHSVLQTSMRDHHSILN